MHHIWMFVMLLVIPTNILGEPDKKTDTTLSDTTVRMQRDTEGNVTVTLQGTGIYYMIVRSEQWLTLDASLSVVGEKVGDSHSVWLRSPKRLTVKGAILCVWDTTESGFQAVFHPGEWTLACGKPRPLQKGDLLRGTLTWTLGKPALFLESDGKRAWKGPDLLSKER